MFKLSIIIPIYNEERTLPELLRRVLALRVPGWEIEIIAVDDASTDTTPKILAQCGTQIKTYRNATNQGKGSTVRFGLQKATGDFMLIQDADLEYDPSEIANLAAFVNNNKTIVYGSRSLHPTRSLGFSIPRLGTYITAKLINLLYGSNMTDVWTCYKIFPAESKNLYPSGKFESDIIFLVRTLRLGYTIIERPISSYNPRNAKEGKKIRYRDGFRGIYEVVKDRLGHL